MVHHHGANLTKQHIVLAIVMAHKPRIATGFMTVAAQYCKHMSLILHTGHTGSKNIERTLTGDEKDRGS